MKIGNPAEKPAPVAQAAAARPANDPAPATAGESAVASNVDPSSTVALSSTAATLLTPAAASTPEFDAAKVERLSAQIAAGTYRPDVGRIADKLIENAAEVLGKVSH